MRWNTIVVIECTKEGIKFSCEGEVGKGGITLKAGGSVDSVSLATKQNTVGIK
jgi:proliferating cell nuclear antigen